MTSIVERIQGLDSFAKTQDDYRTKTFLGGCGTYIGRRISTDFVVTLFCAVSIVTLIYYEYKDYSNISWKPELVVDTNRKSKMNINIDITFPSVPCFALTLDVMDSADQYQNNLNDGITKTRLNTTGEAMGIYVDDTPSRPADYCGSCYAAQSVGPDGSQICCNSCSSVFAAYEHRGLVAPKLDEVEQCVAEKWPEKISKHRSEGCQVVGQFEVNKVSGNFHFAPGKSYDAYNLHLHDVRFLEGLHLDFKHRINHLSFGERHEEIHNPLDNNTIHEGPINASYKYYLKVVAADFKYLSGNILHSNQYAVTQSTSSLMGTDKAAFPSLFFNYEISPMIVIYTEVKKSLASFITGVCAIIGGIYTFAAIIDSLVYSAERKLLNKIAIGKIN